jgi:hypothetical protein
VPTLSVEHMGKRLGRLPQQQLDILIEGLNDLLAG